jgi:hypothetical protein
MIVHRPPPTSRVWDLLTQPQPPSSDGSREPQEPGLMSQEPTPPPPAAESPPRQPGHPTQ